MKIDDELQELKRKHPNHCKTLTVTDSNGVMRELIFPKALDLDRPKRPRTNFTAEQLQILEDEFERNQYLVGKDRNDLSRRLQLSETQVKIWFQNRRTKFKKDQQKTGLDDEGGGDLLEGAVEGSSSGQQTKVTDKSVSPSSSCETPSACRPAKQRRKPKEKRHVPIVKEDSLSGYSDDSFFAGISSPSPQLPTIQPPLLSGLALPPTLPALAGQSQPVLDSQPQRPVLSPTSLLAALQQQQQQPCGQTGSPSNSASTPFSSASHHQASSDMANALLQQKMCVSLGVALASSSRFLPSSSVADTLTSANGVGQQTPALGKSYSITSMLDQASHSKHLFPQQLAPYLLPNGNSSSTNANSRLPPSYWNLVLP